MNESLRKTNQLIFSAIEQIGFGTYSENGGCQGFKGPNPSTFLHKFI